MKPKSKKKFYSKEFKIQAVKRCKLVGTQKANSTDDISAEVY